jgi:hypothetical protein
MTGGRMTQAREWVRLRVRSADERRLDALRTTFAGRLYRRGKAARNAGTSLGSWGDAADSLLSESEVAVRRYDFETAWACFQEATRMEIFAFDHDELEAARTTLRTEAAVAVEAGVDGEWRDQAILRLLDSPEQTFSSRLAALLGDPEAFGIVKALVAGPERDETTFEHVTKVLYDFSIPRPTQMTEVIWRLADERDQARRTTLYAAMSLRDEEGAEDAARLSRVRRQLLIVGGIVVAAMVALLMVATAVPVALTQRITEAPAVGALWWYVALFGILGGGISALRAVSSRVTRYRVPRHLIGSVLAAVRPLIGAIPALATFVILQTGVVSALVRSTIAGALVVAFLAGFTERWIVRAVEPLHLPDLEENEEPDGPKVRGELPARVS